MYPKYTEIQIPLLLELDRRDGSARPRDHDDRGRTVYESLAEHFQLAGEALNTQIGGAGQAENKWENMVRWARNDLRKLGQLDGSTRGVWALTDLGRERIRLEAREPHWLGLGGTQTTLEEFEAQQAENTRIGNKGEVLALEHERTRLRAANREDLAAKVKHIALINVGAGFDIESFTDSGVPVAIGVKTTKGTSIAGFEITQNEWRAAQKHGQNYWVYRICDIDGIKPTITEYKDLDHLVTSQRLQLQATAYRVVLGQPVRYS